MSHICQDFMSSVKLTDNRISYLLGKATQIIINNIHFRLRMPSIGIYFWNFHWKITCNILNKECSFCITDIIKLKIVDYQEPWLDVRRHKSGMEVCWFQYKASYKKCQKLFFYLQVSLGVLFVVLITVWVLNVLPWNWRKEISKYVIFLFLYFTHKYLEK